MKYSLFIKIMNSLTINEIENSIGSFIEFMDEWDITIYDLETVTLINKKLKYYEKEY